MDDNKKYLVTKFLFYLFFFITFIIILFQQIFENDVVVFILIIVFTLSFLIFRVLNEKYDENKSKKQLKNTAIFASIIYILSIICYSLIFFSDPENSIFIIIAIFIVNIIYHIKNDKIKKQNPIDKFKS